MKYRILQVFYLIGGLTHEETLDVFVTIHLPDLCTLESLEPPAQIDLPDLFIDVADASPLNPIQVPLFTSTITDD